LPDPILADSITRIGADAVGAVVVTGSHGGVYAAWLARKGECRAAIFNDAGVGLDGAGVGGLAWLEACGMAAAGVDHRSADIGDAAMMLERGVIAHANARARALGLCEGMACGEAARLLTGADLPVGEFATIEETRAVTEPPRARRRLVLIDSAALVASEDAGHVIVTGSHGALFGGDPMNALKVDAALALFNDAGGGVGTTRLPALQTRGVAAATVTAASARIGEARSTLQDGILSACNEAAMRLGGRPGMPARDLVELALRR
jgi:hypothetical protein